MQNVAATSGGGGGGGSTWSAARSSTDYALSNGNLTATNSNGTAADRLLRGSLANTVGYFEVVPTISSGHTEIGATTGSAATTDYPSLAGIGYNSTGIVNVANVGQAGTWPTYTSSD